MVANQDSDASLAYQIGQIVIGILNKAVQDRVAMHIDITEAGQILVIDTNIPDKYKRDEAVGITRRFIGSWARQHCSGRRMNKGTLV